MEFPYTRHFQRYEFAMYMGFVNSESVMDIGSGTGAGSVLLTSVSKEVISVDPYIKQQQVNVRCLANLFPTDYIKGVNPKGKLYMADVTLEEFFSSWEFYKNKKLGSVMCVEVIEHIEKPDLFLNLIAKMTNNLFITTPLSDETKVTTNPYHVVEYSKYDFEKLVKQNFNILGRFYQKGDLKINQSSKYTGDSMNHKHTTQMLWCKRRRKNGGKK